MAGARMDGRDADPPISSFLLALGANENGFPEFFFETQCNQRRSHIVPKEGTYQHMALVMHVRFAQRSNSVEIEKK
jgi:hypothetical protein